MKIISWNMNYWNQKSVHEKAWEYLVNYAAPDISSRNYSTRKIC